MIVVLFVFLLYSAHLHLTLLLFLGVTPLMWLFIMFLTDVFRIYVFICLPILLLFLPLHSFHFLSCHLHLCLFPGRFLDSCMVRVCPFSLLLYAMGNLCLVEGSSVSFCFYKRGSLAFDVSSFSLNMHPLQWTLIDLWYMSCNLLSALVLFLSSLLPPIPDCLVI